MTTRAIAVVLLDLDRFKVINESLGHAAGDRCSAVGQRLVNGLRPGDTVARFGGDEFGIILDPVADAAEARASPTGSPTSSARRSRSTAATGSSARRSASRWRSPGRATPTS